MVKKKKEVPLLRLDFGCGPNKKEGFVGVDSIKFKGVDVVFDLSKGRWPWKDNSVDEVHASHFLEHLTGKERIVFFNEMFRVLKKGSGALITVPHWSSGRAYGDVTHQWPPVVEFFWYYLDKDWRTQNAPHCPFTCDFSVTWGYSISPEFQVKNQEQQNFGVSHYREVAQDMIATAVKK